MAGRKKYRRKKNAVIRPPKPLSSSGLPLTKVVKMRYVHSFTLDAGIGTVAHQVFRANSIFDPDLTGTGRQPLGHDEWNNFYGTYQVIGSKIRLSVASQGAAAYTGTGIITLRLTHDPAPSGGFDTVDLEQRDCSWKVYNSGYAGNNWKMSKGFSLRRFFQTTTLDDDTTMRAFGANPAKEGYYVISTRGVDATGNPDAVDIVAQIDYIVMLRDPKDLASS